MDSLSIVEAVMNDGLKQRLIGAIVLLAIAVIFIPTLFDRPKIDPVDNQTQISQAPSITMEPITVAEPPVVASPAPAPTKMLIPSNEGDDVGNDVEVTSASTSTTPLVTTPTVQPSVLNNNGVPRGWVLQLVSYTEELKANQLRDQLIADKHPAFVRAADIAKGRVYRVYMGPKLDKNKLLNEQPALDARYKVKSIILDITPTQ
ncbi:MAG: SPOR domain-containing protein [Marinagarivorans sp.]|nr:SPOR domain-containing protein [Marinagarivorans sp.]